MSAAAAPIKTEEECFDLAISKVIFNQKHYAIYYSRNLIPASKSRDPVKIKEWIHKRRFYKNCGLYAFRNSFLDTFHSLPVGPLQEMEDLEQLKAIEHGFKIKVALVEFATHGVDTQQQLDHLNQLDHNLLI